MVYMQEPTISYRRAAVCRPTPRVRCSPFTLDEIWSLEPPPEHPQDLAQVRVRGRAVRPADALTVDVGVNVNARAAETLRNSTRLRSIRTSGGAAAVAVCSAVSGMSTWACVGRPGLPRSVSQC
jgi:hypothetical protein